MPWRPLLEICREVEQIPLRLTPTAATELTGAFARRLGVNPSEISHAALLEVARLAIPKNLETVMRLSALEMKWLASGRRSADGKREVIRPDHWAFLTLDIELQVVRGLDGKVVYADVKGAFGNDLTEEEWQSVEYQLAPPSPAPVSKAGTTVPTDDVAAHDDQLQRAAEPPDKRPRNRNVETEVLFRNRIEGVFAKVKVRWPDPQKRPGVNQMARLLVAEQPESKVKGFGEEAIRKILPGTYKPMKNSGIPGLSSR